MKPKSTRIFYYVSTILFAVLMLADGFGGVSQQEDGKLAMKHLGYPQYILLIVGVSKLLGAVAILQNKFKTLKEWAYAGFTFNFLGAAASLALNGDGFPGLWFPIIALVLVFITYFAWKKFERAQPVHVTI